MASMLRVGGLWRYPVKSLGGEALDEAVLTADGVAGDRVVHVRGSRGPLTGRTRHGLLTVPASTGADGVPLVDGSRWDSAAAAERVRRAAGDDAQLVAFGGSERFDILNLLVATDGAVAALGHDVRRLRPNVLISGTTSDDEVAWLGRAIEIGDAVIGLYARRGRCIVTTIDPDTGAQDLDVLRRIRREFDGRLALDSWVIAPGVVRVGDPVRVTDTVAEPDHVGGWILGAPYEAS